MTGYTVEIISLKKKDELMEKLHSKGVFERKASIHGTCVKFFTDNRDFKEMWEDNFEPMPEWVRPHARVFAVSSHESRVSGSGSRGSKSLVWSARAKLRVLYEPLSKTIVIENCDYYGWVKSIALGLVANFMEDFTSEHQRHSVHGSFVDCGGRGIALIGPSGSGKTTLTYGLLRDVKCNFLTDDWFFVRFANDDTLVYSSEKNSYIRADLARVWPEYARCLDGVKLDSKERGVIDVKKLLGGERIRSHSVLDTTVLLTRDKSLAPWTELKPKEAIAFMMKNDFCNPHQLVRTREKIEKRKAFFTDLFSRAPVYLLNTVETPKASLARLKDLIRSG